MARYAHLLIYKRALGADIRNQSRAALALIGRARTAKDRGSRRSYKAELPRARTIFRCEFRVPD
jgi:hypothetical protein